MDTVRILNLCIDNIRLTDLLAQMESGAVFTPNVDHLIQLQKDEEFVEAYRQAEYRLCDSKVLVYASRLLGTPFVEKISGSDLFPAFYRHHRSNGAITIFLLGAREGVAAEAQRRINAAVGRTQVVGSYSPPFGFEHDPAECSRILQRVCDSGATVLAVGLGAPKQEKFIHRFRHQLPSVRLFLAIGATIDFEAGNVSRSPRFVSEAGFEWLYRLWREPRRLWRRYLLEGPTFFRLLLLQRFGLYRDPWAGRG